MLTALVAAALAAEPALPALDTPHRAGARAEHDAAVVIGIEDYYTLPDVPYAGRDADLMADTLVYTVGVPPGKVWRLGAHTAREDILGAVQDAAAAVGPGGTLWFYFAGHGAARPEDGERAVLGVDTQAKVDSFNSRSVPLSLVESLAEGKRAVILTDACYTGTARDGAALFQGARAVLPTALAAPRPAQLRWTAAGAGEAAQPLESVRHGAFTYLVAGALRGWADGELDGARDGAVTAEEAAQFVQQGLRRVGRLDQRPSAEVVDARGFVLSRGTEPAPSFDAPVAVAAAAPPPAAPAPTAPTPAAPPPAAPLASTATEAAILGLFNELGPPGGASAPAAQPTFSDDAMAAFARGLGQPASAPPAPQAAVAATPGGSPGEPVTVGGMTLWPYAQADGRVEWVLDTLEPVSDGRGLQAALHRVAHTHDAPAYSLYERNTMAWIDLPRGYPEPDEPALEEVEPAARPIHHDTVIPGVGWDLVLLGRTPAREIAGAYRDRCVMRSVSASRARPCRAGGAPAYGEIEGAGEYGPTAMPSLHVQEGVVTRMYLNTRHCNSRTPEGIRPCDGSTTRELIAAYGPPTRVEPFGGQDEWVYGPIGLIARVRGDRVEELVITLPEGGGNTP